MSVNALPVEDVTNESEIENMMTEDDMKAAGRIGRDQGLTPTTEENAETILEKEDEKTQETGTTAARGETTAVIVIIGAEIGVEVPVISSKNEKSRR